MSSMLLVLIILLTTIASLIAATLALELTSRVAIIGSFVGLQLTHNTGIAYGIRIPSPYQELLIGGALFLIFYTAIREHRTVLYTLAYGLIIGGALGNIIDRFMHGSVTDYIQVGSFYIFNVADSAITVGAVLMVWPIVRGLFAGKSQIVKQSNHQGKI